jgi:hypothetical protein
MRMKVIVSLILSLMAPVLLFACKASDDGGGQPAASSSASEVRRLIKTKGAKAALAELTSDTEKWGNVMIRMFKGEEAWLENVIDLYKVSDGGAALDLEIVSAEALVAAPKRVLVMLEPVVGLEGLCGNIMTVGTDFQAALQKIEARRAAVRGIHDRKLADKRLACLKMLDSLEVEVRAAKERGDMQ